MKLRPNLTESHDQLLNEAEVARLTGQGIPTLRNDRFLRRGISYVKLGRSVRYRLGDVLDYIAAHRVEPGQDGE